MTGTLLLARVALRRDRFLIAIWFLLLVGVCYASAAATDSLYTDGADRVRAAEALNASPGIVALYGPVLDVHSAGEFAMTKLTVLYAVFVAVFVIVLVRRHTRSEEEQGLTELVASGAVGRAAPLAAAVVDGVLVATGLGALAALADIAGGLDVSGSLAFGASWTGVGIVSVGIAAVACQLFASARSCTGAAAAAIALAYVLRAVGDVEATWLSWLSPFGWSTQLRAWSDPRWWVLGLYVALAAGLVAAAFLLRSRRDLSAGLFPDRPGPVDAVPGLGSELGLTWRLHRTVLLTWTVATASLSALFGAIVPGFSGLLDSETVRRVMEGLGGVGVAEQMLLAAELSVIAVVLTCFGIGVFAHAATDERDGRTGAVLAAGGTRERVIWSLTGVAVGGTLWLLLVAGLSMGAGYAAATGDPAPVVDMTTAGLAHAPAVCLVVMLGALAWCAHPGAPWAGWILLAAFLTLGEFGDLLELPSWLTGLSPYAHVPAMPIESFDFTSTAALIGILALTVAACQVAFRRRDLT